MSTKKSKSVGEQVQDHEQGTSGAEFSQEITEHLREGDRGRAHRAFARGWREAVPDLPLRFTTILVHPERQVIAEFSPLLREGVEPELKLQRKAKGEVIVQSQESGKTVGSLPAADARLLLELEADELYKPRVVEVLYDQRGRFDYIAVELVRPEVRFCSSCGEPHSGTDVNCEKCRRARRPRGEEGFEIAPVHLHEALDGIIEAASDDGEGSNDLKDILGG
jgi:hypothetical protein